jgi:predicted small lipoprotein YifL
MRSTCPATRAGFDSVVSIAAAGRSAVRPGIARRRDAGYTGHMNARSAFLMLAAALALSACGNKGPLVLPDRPDDSAAPAVDAAPAAPTDTAPASEESPPATEPAEDSDAPPAAEPLPQDDSD